MARSNTPALPPIIVGASELGERPDRAVSAGRARRIIRGLYTTDLDTPLERLVRDHVWEIVAHLVPDALIADRSAAATLFAGDTLFLVSNARTRDVELPGLRIAVRRGLPPLDDDPLWIAGLRRSSAPRALVENLRPSRARQGITRTLTDAELGTWVAQMAQQHDPTRLNRIRDRARDLAQIFDLSEEFPRLDDMIGAALGTRRAPTGGLLRATSRGRGWDEQRVAAFTTLAERLATTSPTEPDHLQILDRRRVAQQPFFESYFSNFIEGTEFALDEAVSIVYDRVSPTARPADAHDVTSTFEIINDPIDSSYRPADGADLSVHLRRQHARLMAVRPDVRPGEFKMTRNRVGSYEFVAPELVEGTLERGYEALAGLTLPIARAVAMMFLVSEVHPFDDGNGRLARLAMNSELSAAGEHRILIPLIIRNDYLAGLRRLSRDSDAGLLVRVLTRAWRWSAQVDFTDLSTARIDLDRTNALVDAADAERTGRHLRLPAELG